MNSPVDLTEQTLVTIAKDQPLAGIPGELVILHPVCYRYQAQDELTARVWELIQSPITLGEILAVLRREYEVGVDEGMRDLKQLLEELLGAGLAEVKGEALQNLA